MIDSFINIGFEYTRTYMPGAGWVREFKYYPSYMGDNHYTLILFTYGKIDEIKDDTEYRLYIHRNINGEYVNSPFQEGYYSDFIKDDLKDKFEKLFYVELRDQRIDEVLK